jgi:WD40 repeat protein
VQAVVQFTAGEAAGGALSATAAALARDALSGLGTAKITVLAAVLLAVGALGLAAGLPSAKREGPEAQARAGLGAVEAAPGPPAEPELLRTDQYGDPLPPGALARLGTGRLRNAQGFHAVSFSRDGKSLVSAGVKQVVYPSGYEWMLQRWEAATGKETQRFTVPGTFMAFSPDHSVWAGHDTQNRRIRLWDAATGKERRVLEGEVYYAVSGTGAFSSDGRTFAAEAPGFIRLWDVASGKEVRRIKCNGRPQVLVFSPDNRTLATACHSRARGLVQLWEVASGKHVRTLEMPGEAEDANSVAFSPDGAIVAAGWQTESGLQRVALWEAAGGKQLHEFKGMHHFAFAPDGKAMALASKDALILSDLDGKTTCTLEKNSGGVSGLAFTPDGKTLAAISSCLIRLWDVPSGKEINARPGHTRGVYSLAVSPQGKYAASGSLGDLWLWDLATGKAIRQFKGHTGAIDALAFSPDGKRLVSGGENNDSTIRLWDVDTGKHLCKLKDGYGGVGSSLVFSPDGKTIASKARLWDAATGAKIREFPFGSVNAVAFSPDGKRLALGSYEGLVRLWDLTGEKMPNEWNANGLLERANGWDSCFSPDLKMTLVRSVNNHKTVWLCDTAAGRVLETIPQPWVVSAAFSPDGKILALAGEDIGLWETATGKEIRRLKGHRDGISSVAFTADGKALVSASRDNTVLVWQTLALDGARRKNTRLSERELLALWSDLADPDAGRAYRAMAALALTPAQTIALLQQHLPPTSAPEAKRLAQWVADLDSDQFAVRERASQELEEQGELVAPALRKVLASGPTLEVRTRVTRLLGRIGRSLTREQLQGLRAVQVLEQVGGAEAKQLLDKLAQGAEAARLTHDARAALTRLTRRAAP